MIKKMKQLLACVLLLLFVCVANSQVVQYLSCSSDLSFYMYFNGYNRYIKGGQWMGDINYLINSKRLSEVKIPGTTNSASSSINVNSTFSSDSLQGNAVGNACVGLSTLFPYYGVQSGKVNQLLAPWAKDQDCGIDRQLQHGSRYFDLKVCIDSNASGSGRFVSCNMLTGTQYLQILQQFKSFLDLSTSTKEFLILDFRQLYGFTQQDVLDFTTLVNSIVGTYTVDPSSGIGFSSTVSAIIASGKRVFVVLPSGLNIVGSGLNAFSSDSLEIPVVSTQDVSVLQSTTVSQLSSRSNFNKLFVTESRLLPSMSLIVDGIFTGINSTLKVATTYYTNFQVWVNNNYYSKNNMNVMIVDNYNQIVSQYFVAIIRKNF